MNDDPESKRFLAELQSAVFRARGFDVRKLREAERMSLERTVTEARRVLGDTEQGRARLERDLADHVRSTSIPLPTEYERAVVYSRYQRYAAFFDAVLGHSGRAVSNTPLFGTLLTGRMNGLSVRVPSTDKYIVLIEDGLFGLTAGMTNALALGATDWGSNKELLRFGFDRNAFAQLPEDHDGVDEFFRSIATIVLRDYHELPRGKSQYELPEAAVRFAGNLSELMELFVIGHEYGHVVRRHLHRYRPTRSPVLGKELDEVQFSWEDEFEADRAAIELIIESDRGTSVAVPLCIGAELFFTFCEHVAEAASILQGGAKPNAERSSHPPPADRRARIRKAVLELEPGEETESGIEVSAIIQECANSLWEKVKPRFETLQREGARPARGWVFLIND